jgi:CubicO group peptidase (beta-lactamase class C family)
MPARRSLPDYPNLRYLKVEAKERMRSGEFAALHEAQLAIAREHGLPGWPALCRLAGQQMPAQSWVLPHVRWLISRFRDAGEPGWAPPNDGEARQHFTGEFLDVVQMQQLFEIIASDAARLGEELLVLALTPRTGRFRHVGREIWVGVEAEPPHLISGLTGYSLGSRITDPRLGAPYTSAEHDVPSPATAAVGEVISEHGLPGLVLAGQAGRDAPLWTAASGWADLDLREPMTAGHRFPAHHISQLITAAGVLRLIASTDISLDDPANDRLRTITLADPGVTIRELLTHTGGVDTLSSSGPYDPVLRERVPPLADLCGPVLACTGPRGSVQVSAGGYAALGQLITDLTGLPYPDAATRLVLGPLGMTASSFPASLPGIGAGTLTRYHVSLDVDSLVSVPPNITAIPAAFGLWTTAADLVRFGTGWASLLPASLAREALRPQARMAPGEGSMGLGWFIDRDRAGAGLSGTGPGTTASLLIRRAGKQVQAAVTNREIPIEYVNRRILDTIPPP